MVINVSVAAPQNKADDYQSGYLKMASNYMKPRVNLPLLRREESEKKAVL